MMYTVRYAKLVVAERVAYQTVRAWQDVYDELREHMASLHPAAAATMHHELRQFESDAIYEHAVAEETLAAAYAPRSLVDRKVGA